EITLAIFSTQRRKRTNMNTLPNQPSPGGFNKEKLQSLVQRVRYLQSQDTTSTFTQGQLAALKYQILAYKLISKNLALPAHIQQAVLSPSSALALENATPTPPPPATAQSTPVVSTEKDTKKMNYNAYASPFDLFKKPITSFSHASRQQRLLIPSITPSGVDPYALISERERRVLGRIQYRISELEKLPSNLQDTTHALENNIRQNSSMKLKAVVELKALRLLNKQRQLREEIMAGMKRSTTLATSADRLAYRRMKKQSLREARMTEKMERQQRTDREHREKQKHLDYLQTICDHGRNLTGFQANYRAKQNKLGRAVLQYHQHIEKEEQKRAERISKERIRALKNDDEEAYLKLIDEAKDTRLTQLLKQTGSFLDTNDPDAKYDYFQVTHRIKEEVTQPEILVGGRLKDYQIKGLQWMVSLYNNHLNGILADEMGLGKTIQTISLITYLIEKKRQNGPFLIIVPLSTLTNWTLEFEKWAPAVKTIVYKGPPNVRRELQNEIRYHDFQVVLTTFEYIIKDRPVLSKVKWLHMIVDEGHRMKNTNSKLTIVLRQYYHTRYRLILTGTPLQNNLPELWALLNFILPKIFKSVKSFEEWFNTPFNNQGVADKIGLNEEEQLLIIKRLHKVLRPFLLRRLKRDVESELPDKVERVIKCKLSPLQVHLYSQMKRNGTLYTSDAIKGKSSLKGLNNTIMQLRKICNHPFVFEEVESVINPSGMSNDLLYRTSGKFELLDRMLPKLQQTGHRVLIFFQMTQVMSIMEDFLSYKGFSYLRLDGSTKADDPRAQYKLDIDGKVIQAGKFDHRSTEEDREAFLRSLLEDKTVTIETREADEESDEMDDEELNTILKRSDQEYAIFTKIDLERQRTDAEEWRRKYGDNGKKPERLLQEWELPDIYRDEHIHDTEDTIESVMGRGQRSRENVRYDDGMTEKQWLRQLEEGEED
ncbi:hypothetical protein CU098_003167, partial [Rhizopus stolonifer]